jgi:Tol biopolymer transport system component
MTDVELEQRLRAWYRDSIPESEVAPTALHDAIVEVTAAPPRRAADARSLMVLLAAALLLAGAIGAAIVIGSGLFRIPSIEGAAPYAIVIEDTNEPGEFDDIVTTHTAISDGGSEPRSVLAALPPNAVLVRYSPDGRRLTYFEQISESTFILTGLFVADADGSDPRQVTLPRDAVGYGAAAWSPLGDRLAVIWDAHMCTGSPDCLPDTFIDVFDASGQAVASIPVTDGLQTLAQWSPDGKEIGWHTGECIAGSCQATDFHTTVVGSDDVRTLNLEEPSWVTWSTDGRLLVLELATNRLDVARAYSIAPDGSDVRDVRWDQVDGSSWPVWSPDGRWLAFSTDAGMLMVRNAQTGEDTVLEIPDGSSIHQWSPDSERLILAGPGGAHEFQTTFHVINVDGSGLTLLGEGRDVSWLPVP